MADIVRYGSHPDQHIVVRPPSGVARWTAVLIHGGYWKSLHRLDLMDPMADALAAAGVTTWNVEYRRPDRHGWAATTRDLSDALGSVDDVGRRVVIGHSAGGQLALRAVADARTGARSAAGVDAGTGPDRVPLGVSLAGVVDLELADRWGKGEGAVRTALGHHWAATNPDDVNASPRHRLPLGIPQIIAWGHDDDPQLVEITRQYRDAAREAGDDVIAVSAPGDHFDIIDPTHALWAAVLSAIEGAIDA